MIRAFLRFHFLPVLALAACSGGAPTTPDAAPDAAPDLPGAPDTLAVTDSSLRDALADASPDVSEAGGPDTDVDAGLDAADATDVADAAVDTGGCATVCAGGRTCVAGRCEDAWLGLTTDGAPSRRTNHGAVWTGSEMIVWGGEDTAALANGARYDPVLRRWQSMSTDGAPSARADYAMVWTGSEVIVWGGRGPMSDLADGARYDPARDSWRAMATAGAPAARTAAAAVWTGSEMIVWGGTGNTGILGDGGLYDPAHDTWRAMPAAGDPGGPGAPGAPGAPAGRTGAAAVWTGTEFVVIAGSTPTGLSNTGGRYDPVRDAWRPTTPVGAPAPRSNVSVAWTGREVFVWGGYGPTITQFSDGGLYDPAADRWRAVASTGAPSSRGDATAVWTGREALVWGGVHLERPPGMGLVVTYLGTGGRYTPDGDRWAEIDSAGVPSARYRHSVVWTGSEMIVWGGTGMLSRLQSGGRYQP